MALKIIGSPDCRLCGQPAPVGLSRDGEGAAVHQLCPRCETNLQARRSGPVGLMLIEEAHRSGRQVTGPTAPAALNDAPETHAVEPEAAEVTGAEQEPEPEPVSVAAERPPDGDPYLANIP